MMSVTAREPTVVRKAGTMIQTSRSATFIRRFLSLSYNTHTHAVSLLLACHISGHEMLANVKQLQRNLCGLHNNSSDLAHLIDVGWLRTAYYRQGQWRIQNFCRGMRCFPFSLSSPSSFPPRPFPFVFPSPFPFPSFFPSSPFPFPIQLGGLGKRCDLWIYDGKY